MFGCILTRMIFWELVKVFVLCLIAITGILLMAGIVAEASQQGLNPAQTVAIIPLLIPSTLPYTIPATTLEQGRVAAFVVYEFIRLNNLDNFTLSRCAWASQRMRAVIRRLI